MPAQLSLEPQDKHFLPCEKLVAGKLWMHNSLADLNKVLCPGRRENSFADDFNIKLQY